MWHFIKLRRRKPVNTHFPLVVSEPSTSASVDSKTPEKSKHAIFYEEVMRRLERQFESVESLDAKIGTWFQSVTLVVTILVGVLTAEKDSLRTWIVIVAGSGFFLYLLGMAALFVAQKSVILNEGSSVVDYACNVRNVEISADDLYLSMAWLIGTEDLVTNTKAIRHKIRWLNIAVALFTLAILTLILAALLGLWVNRQ